MATQSTVMESRKITVDDYRTIWRRSRESYFLPGEYEPKENTYHPIKEYPKDNIVSKHPSRIKKVVSTPRVVPISHPLERRVASPLKWFPLRIGGLDWSDLQNELERGKYQITASARKIMNMMKIEPTLAESQEIELFSFLVKDINPKEEWTSPAKFYAKAEYLGYGPCPMEVGPYLRLTIQNQRPGEELYIGMKPVTLPDAPRYPLIFCVRQDGVIYHDRNIGRWLAAVHADADHKGGFAPDNQVLLTKI